MTESLELRLTKARAALDEAEWLGAKLQETILEGRRLDERVDALALASKREQAEVDELEGFSFQSVLQVILGGKEAKLEKERGEAIAARLKHEAAKAELDDLRQRIVKLHELVGALGDVQGAYDAILVEQKEWLVSQGGELGQQIMSCAERQGHLRTKLREIDEAIEAGQDAENIMAKMLGYLREARGWGWADITGVPAGGGPLLDGWNKYDAFGAAHVDAVDARQALSRLQSALKDVHLGELNIDYPGEFVQFADWFFDGLAADLFVQSKIGSSLDSVETSTAQVQAILEKLRPAQRSVQEELDELAIEMTRLLEKNS